MSDLSLLAKLPKLPSSAAGLEDSAFCFYFRFILVVVISQESPG